jgi:hypothetical protein
VTRIRCLIGRHVMRAWPLPDDVQREFLAVRWSWSSNRCDHCGLAKVVIVEKVTRAHHG